MVCGTFPNQYSETTKKKSTKYFIRSAQMSCYITLRFFCPIDAASDEHLNVATHFSAVFVGKPRLEKQKTSGITAKNEANQRINRSLSCPRAQIVVYSSYPLNQPSKL
jgi:hypothetical protein